MPESSTAVFFNFFNACVSGCAAVTCTHPLDVMKVRLQLAGEGGGGKASPISVAKNLLAEGGPKQFYSGLSAALLRQVFYGSSRLGLFNTSLDYCQHHNDGKPLPF